MSYDVGFAEDLARVADNWHVRTLIINTSPPRQSTKRSAPPLSSITAFYLQCTNYVQMEDTHKSGLINTGVHQFDLLESSQRHQKPCFGGVKERCQKTTAT